MNFFPPTINSDDIKVSYNANNATSQDPINPNMQVSSRLLMGGSKSRKLRKLRKSRKSRKLRKLRKSRKLKLN